MNLENVMLSETSQMQKDSYCMIPSKVARLDNFIKPKVEQWLPGVDGGGE